jgi:hypothetical protein
MKVRKGTEIRRKGCTYVYSRQEVLSGGVQNSEKGVRGAARGFEKER